jgi:hypothetical protein
VSLDFGREAVMTNAEKQKLIVKALGSRMGRRNLGRAMSIPLLRPYGKKPPEGWHDCAKCSRYEACKIGVEIENLVLGDRVECWVPEGLLSVWEEVQV